MKFSYQGLTYRLFTCALCATLVLICSQCDFGHRYCSEEHSKEGRRKKHAEAQAKYQRDHYDTWRPAHKDQQKAYRDREREQAQATRLMPCAAGVSCAVPAVQLVVAANDPQTTASSSSSSSSSAPEKVVATGSLIPQTQQKETSNPVTAITFKFKDSTEKGFVTVAVAVQCPSPDTGDAQGAQHLKGLTPEGRWAQEQAASSVTDQTLASPATQANVSAQAHPATDNTSEQSIAVRLLAQPICCIFCSRRLAQFDRSSKRRSR